MVYHSLEFAVLLSASLVAFYLAPLRLRPWLLLIFSYLFYTNYHAWHLLILLGVTAACYIGGVLIARKRSRRRLILFVGVVLVCLLFFKYYVFLYSLAGRLDVEGRIALPNLNPVLPIGISFFTFQGISYLVDVYEGRFPAERRLSRIALYLSFFPQVLAGPIERPQGLIPQLDAPRGARLGELFIGTKVILWGLFCKLVIADKLALIVDAIYAQATEQPGLAVIVAVYTYSFVIFFDFYGYTNISIGLAKLFGIDLSINFNNPYLSRSIREFWHRWHITLSTWFRDYLYLPLGGRSHSRTKWFFNIIVVFALSGLWHGAALNFLMWGLVHGMLYVIGASTVKARDRWMRTLRLDRGSSLRSALQVFITFSLVSAAWLPFRVGDPSQLATILRQITTVGQSWAEVGSVLVQPSSLIYIALLTLTYLLQASGFAWRTINRIPQTPLQISKEVALVNLLVLGLVLIGDVGARDYIYFRF